MVKTIDAIRQIESDYRESTGPFSDVEFPERRLLRILESRVDGGLSAEGRLQAVSTFAMLDYNRNANQLTDKLLELHERQPSYFDPNQVPLSEKSVEQVLQEISFRYPSRDAHAICRNAEIVRNNYHGRWSDLVFDTNTNAETLVTRLQYDDFLYLKGAKIAPMYARIINDEVTELDKLWELNIPLDTHVRRLTKDLFDKPDASDEWIRHAWKNVADRHQIQRHIVDGAMWHIGNKWDEWGEEYWEEVTNA
jgi:endonuclease III